ncbi:MAG: ATP-binding cassette domain-containing protein [Candidatus Eisenbacteria bacterium]|nr:ATP-binding cassette domain-containing protein [Candidatus Eisenbacteria bacterium]
MLQKTVTRLVPSLARLLPLLRRYRRRILTGCVWLVITNVLAVIIPWILKSGIDALGQRPDPRTLYLHAGAIVAVAAVAGFFLYLMRRTLIGASREMEYDLRNRFFAHLETLPQEFYSRHPTGDLMARAANDLPAVRDVLGPGIMYFLNTLVSVALALTLMLRIDPVLTAAAFLPFPILAVAVQRFSQVLHRRSRAVQEHFGVMSNMLQEDLSGIRVVKSYVQEGPEEDHFDGLNQEYRLRNMALIRARALFFASMSFLVGTGLLILLWLGGLRVMREHLTVGGFVAFNGYLVLMTWPFIALGWVLAMVQRGEAAMGRVLEILDTEPAVRSPAEPLEPERVQGTLTFENVTLVYPGAETPALDDVSLVIPAGTTAAVVGRTGSGKTSVARLAARLFDPTHGRVLLDGVDLRRVDLGRLRDIVGIILQESFLWSDTLEGNLLFAEPGAGREELDAAARRSRLHKDLPQFTHGWETRVGERGVTLSGGQRQRVALSRAFLRPTPVLILDDTLSSLDNVTQREVLEELESLHGRQTLVIISHRISAVRSAQKIFVMERGRVVEEGAHDELLARGGAYARLFRRQSLLDELEGGAGREVS